jgi:hypothetical protein
MPISGKKDHGRTAAALDRKIKIQKDYALL